MALLSLIVMDAFSPFLGGWPPLYAQIFENAQQAAQTKKELADLLAYVEDLRDQEAAGKKFTAEEADTLGAEAQRQAEAIAGQVTQAAQQLNIELQEA